VERDEALRTACFERLKLHRAEWGDELPYRPALAARFPFRGARVPFLTYQKGIYRAAVQRGPAALSIQTSYTSPYGDAATDDGYIYAYRDAPINHPDNRALIAAHELQVPVVHFVATRPGWYHPIFPCFVTGNDTATRSVVVTKGAWVGPLDEPEPVLPENPIERRYAVREARVRVHQAQFRGRVIPAYGEQCAICRLKEIRLLDAAHIIGDLDPRGEPEIANGLSLCSIHHRAFDHELVGVSPDYEVHVAQRLLEDDDGPMLDVLKGFQGAAIHVPKRRAWKPDRERLAERFERFLSAA
jgi:putative restriction endonuclease